MKHKKIILLLIALSLGLNQNAKCQSSTATNNVFIPNTPAFPGVDFLGWAAAAPAISLDILNEQAQPIHLHTFSTPGLFNNIRQTILGNYNNNSGLIGMGDMNTTAAPYIPNYLLDSYRTGNTDVFHQFVNDNTGIANINGFRIGIRYDNANPFFNNYSLAELRNYENSPMVMYTNNMERIRITTDNPMGTFPNAVTRVGIMENPTLSGFMFRPLSLLQLGFTWQQNAGTHRLWMDVGTYTTAGSDAMYVGLKNNAPQDGQWSDHMGAVIAWGDNIQGPEGADDMHILFSSWQLASAGDAGLPDALEVMRFTPRARVGIGNFTPATAGNGSGIRPFRRLEIYDESVLDIGNGNNFNPAPQLRLTFTPYPNVARGVWTDCQTMPSGDLFINPHFSANAGDPGVNRFVGINTNAPGNTLEINSEILVTTSAREPAGLRFTNLLANAYTAANLIYNNPFIPLGNNIPAVLTVDANGDVILTDDAGYTTCVTANFLPKIDPLNTRRSICSQVYDDATTVSIGWANSPDLNYQFEVTGNSAFAYNPNTSGIAYNFNNTISYPLMVKSGPDQFNNTTGLAILSDEPNIAGATLDRLHIFSDNTGFTNFVSRNNFTVFRDENESVSFLGFYPSFGMTIIKDNFDANPVPPSDDAKLYVEAQYDAINRNYGSFHYNAIYGSNNFNDNVATGGINIGDKELVGVKGQSSRNRSLDVSNNTGGQFIGSGAHHVNRGIHCKAVEALDANYNIAVDAWVAGTEDVTDLGTAGNVLRNFGVHSRVFYDNSADASSRNHGGMFQAEHANTNIGVWGRSLNWNRLNGVQVNFGSYFEALSAYTQNVGVLGYADNAIVAATSNNYGGYFIARNGAINYGIYASSSANNCPPCLAPPCAVPACTQAAGFFAGHVYATNYYWPSDSMLKGDITVAQDPDTAVTNGITTYTYSYDTAAYPSMNLPAGLHYGFLADEVEKAFPNMVTWLRQPAEYDTLGNIIHPEVAFKAVNYIEFIPLLWKGFKSVQQEMDSIKQVMTACCNLAPRTSNPNTNTGSIELENLKSIQLEQNDPNPFSENSIIRWSIPTDFKEAALLFFENSGSLINQYKIEQKGNGELQVFGSKLSSGVYTYTLVVDGKIIDSKKMLKSK